MILTVTSNETSQPPPLGALKTGIGSFYTYLHHHLVGISFLLIFLINLLLVSPSLMPGFSTINPDDEAKYVESGWRLLRGDLRDLAWGPLVSVVFAPLHLVVGSSPDWFMLETWIGRFVLYAFLWWSTFFLALQLKEHVSPYICLGVLFIATPFFAVLKNQSDAVFVGFIALALAYLLKFAKFKKLRDLTIASLMVGLGILARFETILLVAVLLSLSWLIGRKTHRVYQIILSSLLPTLLVLAVFFIASLALVGNFNLGLGYKSYDSFEMNQAILTGGDINLARQETERLFGSQAENHGSVLRAILRNPYAFSVRILANAKTIPENYFVFFGKKLGAVLLLFAAWGCYALIRRKAYWTLAILLIWPLHALVSLGFLALHIIPQMSYVLLIFGAIGIGWLFQSETTNRERVIFFAVTLIVLIASWITAKPAFVLVSLLLVFVLLIYFLVRSGTPEATLTGLIGVFLLLAAGIILHDPFPYPDYPELGKTADEQAVHYLEQNLAEQTVILVPSPLPALASRMAYMTMEDVPQTVTSLQEFQSWLKQNNITAVYLNSNRRVRNNLYDLFETGSEQYFSLVFTSPDASIRIFQLLQGVH